MAGPIRPLAPLALTAAIAAVEAGPKEDPISYIPPPKKKPSTRTPGLRVDPSEGINPKDLIGANKIDLTLIPPIALQHLAAALTDGDLKYGAYNWRVKPVQARTYVAAAIRHLQDWLEGEEYAQDSLAHHLGHTMACCAILLDASAMGHLVDNRPLANPGYPTAKNTILDNQQRRKDKEETP